MAENIGKVIQVSGPAVDVQFEESEDAPDLSGVARNQRGLYRAHAHQRRS